MPASVLHFLCGGVHKSKIAVTIAPPAAAAAAPRHAQCDFPDTAASGTRQPIGAGERFLRGTAQRLLARKCVFRFHKEKCTFKIRRPRIPNLQNLPIDTLHHTCEPPVCKFLGALAANPDFSMEHGGKIMRGCSVKKRRMHVDFSARNLSRWKNPQTYVRAELYKQYIFYLHKNVQNRVQNVKK